MRGTDQKALYLNISTSIITCWSFLQVTGGRSYAVTSQRILHQCIDSLVQKLQSGVVIHFEKVGPDPAPVREVDMTPEDEAFPLSR